MEVLRWFNPIPDGGEGGEKALHNNFSPVTSQNVGISPQNFLTFTFNGFDTFNPFANFRGDT